MGFAVLIAALIGLGGLVCLCLAIWFWGSIKEEGANISMMVPVSLFLLAIVMLDLHTTCTLG